MIHDKSHDFPTHNPVIGENVAHNFTRVAQQWMVPGRYGRTRTFSESRFINLFNPCVLEFLVGSLMMSQFEEQGVFYQRT